MSFVDKKEVKCLCGEIFSAKVFLSVNLVHTPELKDVILEGRFNVVKCPKCKNFIYVEVPFFYLDAQESMVVYVYPKNYEEEKEKYLKEADANFALSMRMVEDTENKHDKYFLQVFFGIEELVKFLTFQEKENDEKDFLDKIVGGLNLKTINFSSKESRQKNIISKLPYVDKGGRVSLENIIEGLSLVLKNYPQLEIYKRLLNDIKFNNIIRENLLKLLEEQEDL